MNGRRSRSLGETALRSQLGIAQQTINSLEGYIRDRDRLYQSTVSRLRGEHHDSVSSMPLLSQRRRRRTGLVLQSFRNMGSSFEETETNTEHLQAPLAEFVSLKLVKIHDVDDTPVPFLLRRLIGRVYHIGPNGAVIGTSPKCTIMLPSESEISSEHCHIKWHCSGTVDTGLRGEEIGEQKMSRLLKQKRIEDTGRFVLEDLTKGTGVMYISEDVPSVRYPGLQEVDEGGVLNEGSFPIYLSHGVRFVTGKLVWDLTALPPEVAFTAKLFHLAEQRDLPNLKKLLDPCYLNTLKIPKLTVTHDEDTFSIPTLDTCPLNKPLDSTYDIDTEYDPPSYEGDEKFNTFFSSQRSTTFQSVLQTPGSINKERPHLLLHVAINNGDVDMLKYLLDKGANVNKCSGNLQYTAVHLASYNNNINMMILLLKYGADLEIRNAEHLMPLALTTNYEIRKLILNSILLCASADAGDIKEVTRLLTATDISPNVKGLRHKSPLHLAALQGHSDTVEFLIINGADVNLKGGSRQRTPLHYASLGGDPRVIHLLLSAGANESSRDIGGYTPLNICKGDACRLLNKQPLSLCLAVQSGDLDTVKKILEDLQLHEDDDEGTEEGKIINLRNDQGHAPLHLAAIIGSLECVEILVSFGAIIDIHGGSDSWTPLFYAAMSGHCQLVEFLLPIGANPEECDSQGNNVRDRVKKMIEETEDRMSYLKQRNRSESLVETDLFGRLSVNMLRQESSPSCSVENELEWQNIKLQKLCDVLSLLTSTSERLMNALESRNITEFISILEESNTSESLIPVLIQTCDDGLYGYTKALLDNGVNPSVVGSTNEIPLLLAASNGHTSILNLLIEHGANVNTQSTDKMSTALHEAATMNELSCVKYLLLVGADVNLTNSLGEMPFDCSQMLDIQMLLASGNNRLLVAASTDDIATISCLVREEGVTVDAEFFHNGYTALHRVSEEGYLQSAELLIKLGADVNKRGGLYQSTPLHLSSVNNHFDIVKMLLNERAKLDAKDCNGKVPFEVATTNQMRKILVEARQIRPHNEENVTSSSNDGKLCLICMDKQINTIILPCGHQSFCIDCATQITTCALDRQPIREVIPVYK